jgi:hypothetical protein
MSESVLLIFITNIKYDLSGSSSIYPASLQLGRFVVRFKEGGCACPAVTRALENSESPSQFQEAPGFHPVQGWQSLAWVPPPSARPLDPWRHPGAP